MLRTQSSPSVWVAFSWWTEVRGLNARDVPGLRAWIAEGVEIHSPCRVVAYVVLLVVTHRGILAHNLVWPFMAGRFSRRIPTEVSPPGVSRLCLIDPEMGSVEPTCGRSGQCSALLCFPSWFWVFGSGSGSREAQSTVDRIVTEKSEGFLDI